MTRQDIWLQNRGEDKPISNIYVEFTTATPACVMNYKLKPLYLN